MFSLYNIVTGLTTDAPTSEDKSTLAQRFASELGWTPSYYLQPTTESGFVNMHLVVEHGLENTAIITFLKMPYGELSQAERRTLLNISYNNMVDWHIQVEQNRILYIYNRYNPSENIVDEHDFKRDDYDKLRSEAFEKIIGLRPSPNIPSLDDSLIDTISYWKRNLSAELDNKIDNEALSLLFNTIIFLRALEDNSKRYNVELIQQNVLLNSWEEEKTNDKNFVSSIFKSALKKLGQEEIPNYLIDFNGLDVFDAVNKQSLAYLLNDFYTNKHNSFYRYDFSIMSMHALSRIYERYISILKVEDSSQLSIFPSLPIEKINKAYGAVYTPQYIARFFARYLKENLSPIEFKKIKVAEPAVGSGIFLRSLLELKCDPRQDGINSEDIKTAFKSILGMDIDPNACKAAELSLALLQLVLTNEFPEKLDIVSTETLNYLTENPHLKGTYDAVISNPPFISTTGQSEEMRKRISEYMNINSKGRVDIFIAFIKAGLELLKPGGYGMYVVPHSFLISTSAAGMREILSKEAEIKCIADLSAIPVFGNTGIYVILLIFQKKASYVNSTPAIILKCRDFVGRALQDLTRKNFVENDFYNIYNVSQSLFENKEWYILPKKELKIETKFAKFKPLGDFLDVKQGFVTGNDEVFILEKNAIPKGEEAIYVPYLPDRKMQRYILDEKEDVKYLFFPYIKDEKLSYSDLEIKFPKTLKYLLSKKETLQTKKTFQNENWWRPLRTRQPEDMMRSKLITPHLTIAPKFSCDLSGKYAVSHTPYLIPKNDDVLGDDILLYFLAVLNSTPCYWYISNHSHKYSRGYTMIEVKTLQKTPVPSPEDVSPGVMKKILTLVQKRMRLKGWEAMLVERELDELICGIYELSEEDKQVIGLI